MQFRYPESYRMVGSYKILWDPASDMWTWVSIERIERFCDLIRSYLSFEVFHEVFLNLFSKI